MPRSEVLAEKATADEQWLRVARNIPTERALALPGKEVSAETSNVPSTLLERACMSHSCISALFAAFTHEKPLPSTARLFLLVLDLTRPPHSYRRTWSVFLAVEAILRSIPRDVIHQEDEPCVRAVCAHHGIAERYTNWIVHSRSLGTALCAMAGRAILRPSYLFHFSSPERCAIEKVVRALRPDVLVALYIGNRSRTETVFILRDVFHLDALADTFSFGPALLEADERLTLQLVARTGSFTLPLVDRFDVAGGQPPRGA